MGFFPMTNYDFPNVSNYDSDLRELIAMYRVVTESYQKLVSNQNALNDMYADLQKHYEDLRRKYDKLILDFDTLDSYTRSVLTNYGVAIDAITNQIIDIQTQVDTLNEQLFAEIVNIKNYSDTQNESLGRELRMELTTAIDNVQSQIDKLEFIIPPVYNPARGIVTELSTLISDWWYWLRYGGYTAKEFDDNTYAPTAGELDSMNHTAIEWDVKGKIYLYGGI